MKVVITGTTGFVGKDLSIALRRNGHGISPVNRNSTTGSYSFNDLFSGKCSGQIWMHLAAQSKDTNNIKLKDKYLEANVALTKKVYNAFIDDKTSTTFIFFSSVKAAASTTNAPLTEDVHLEVEGPYGLSKRLAEEHLRSVELPEGKKLIILRPAMIYGVTTDSNLYSLYKYIKYGLPYPFGALDNLRSFLSINNLSFLIEKIIEADNFAPGVYNVADDGAISTKEIIYIIGDALKKKPFFLNLSKDLIKGIASLGDVLHLPLNTSKIEKLTANYVVSNEKIKKELGTTPPYSAKDELFALFTAFKEKT